MDDLSERPQLLGTKQFITGGVSLTVTRDHTKHQSPGKTEVTRIIEGEDSLVRLLVHFCLIVFSYSRYCHHIIKKYLALVVTLGPYTQDVIDDCEISFASLFIMIDISIYFFSVSKQTIVSK